jgi:hypothetical protein
VKTTVLRGVSCVPFLFRLWGGNSLCLPFFISPFLARKWALRQERERGARYVGYHGERDYPKI